jgi:hypothetical protein
VMRMPEERWPAVIHSWIPPGRRKRGWPRRSWRDGITEAIKKGGWGKKTPRTGYFGGEDWEGGGQPYKPVHSSNNNTETSHFLNMWKVQRKGT